MDEKTFKKKVSQQLATLTDKQVKEFAWRCGVRALPFLASKGSFDCWPKQDRQKYLYGVLVALDIAAARVFDIEFEFDAYAFRAGAGSVSVSVSAVYASDSAASAVYAAANQNQINMAAAILDDLAMIKANQAPQLSSQSYGTIWSGFQQALEREGCGYWARLYQDIFDPAFGLDKARLKARLNVPKEIKQQGAAAVGRYLAALETQGAERLNEARIIILGEKGAGKTCLARRLVNPAADMTTPDESTAGVETTLWLLKEDNIKVRIWDFAGHTVTHAVHQFFLSERCLYIVVYDGRTENRNRLTYWLDHMTNYGGNSTAIILVNEQDRHSVDIQVNNLTEKYPILQVCYFSIKDDKTKLDDFRQAVAAYIRDNPCWNQQLIPKNYYQVKQHLETIFNKDNDSIGQEHITKQAFEAIAKQHKVDDIDNLLRDLHALGVSLWYDDMADFDTLILNPEWISHGVYQIINWVHEHKKYAITLNEFEKVFAADLPRFPISQHLFLFSLMKRYELAYETTEGDHYGNGALHGDHHGSGERSLVIPHLLREDRPQKLPEFPVGESLMIKYLAEQPLPPHTISRFIVRHHQNIQKAASSPPVWRFGVVLTDGRGGEALVREEDRTISIAVKGPNKTEFISLLRDTLNDIFASYQSKKPQLLYRVECFGQIVDSAGQRLDVTEDKNALWLPDRKILNHARDGVPYYEDVSRQTLDLNDTRAIYNINATNLIMGGQGNIIEDKSNHFNFKDCNLGLQGDFNQLAQYLTENGHTAEAKELQQAAKALEQAEQCNSTEEVKKNGIGKRLGRLVEDLADKNSTLHKSVTGLKHGASIAQDIAKGYNSFAQWCGMPQVPEVFLKQKK